VKVDMIRKGGLKQLIESHKDKVSNGNIANIRAAKQFGRLMDKGEISVDDISFKALMEAAVEAEGMEEVPSDVEELKEAVSKSSFPKMTKYVISKIAIPEFEYREEGLQPLYTEVETNSSSRELLEGLTAAEGLAYVAPQEPYEGMDFGEKTAKIHVDKFGRRIDLPMELVMEDKNGRIRDKASQIGEKFGEQFEKFIIQTVEIDTRDLIPYESTSRAAIFNDTTISKGNFYSDDHSSVSGLDGQTNDNVAAPSSAFSVDGLKAGLTLFNSMKDEEGDLITVIPKIILTNLSNEIELWKVLNTAAKPGSNENTKNYFGPQGKKSFDVVSSPFLSVSDGYYMGDFKKQLVVVWGKRPTVTTNHNSEDSYSRDIVSSWKISTIFGAGHRDYRYIGKVSESA
jgi:hypothetical protein